MSDVPEGQTLVNHQDKIFPGTFVQVTCLIACQTQLAPYRNESHQLQTQVPQTAFTRQLTQVAQSEQMDHSKEF